ncbi:MAG TPA: hypothetical protein VJ378_02015 [Candidatus Paceibacterota bacterium]|nr:hypothetical protein [Candidatus Paceibacterota bacterium]
MTEKEYNFNPEVSREKLPEIEGLRERVLEREAELGNEAPELRKKIIKEDVKGKLRELHSLSPSDIPLSDRDEAKEIAKFSSEKQIEALVFLVFEKGLERAVSVSKRIDSPAVIDEFHDILADKYYEMMVSQGVIKI